MFILERLIDIVAPFECLVCGHQNNLLCHWCRADALPPVPSRCYKCCAQTKYCTTCPKCRPSTPLKQVWVATDYAGVAQELTKGLKFGHKRQAAEVMAAAIAGTLPYVPPDTLVSFVPTAAIRVRQRGFDHAALISRQLARQLRLAHVSLLRRQGHTRQVGAKREQRLKQLENAFWVNNTQQLKGKTVMLIDDVLTTGATLEAAARTLRAAGARSVYAAVFSQKLN